MSLSYGLLVGYIIATTQTFVLLVQIPRGDNGYDLPPSQVALLQNCAAGGLMLTQLLVYPWLVQKKGYRWCITCGILVVMAVTFPFPLYGLMADPAVFGAWRFLPLGFVMFAQQSAFGLCTPSINVWINRFAAGMDRGSINGWTNSFAALCRALAPVFCSSLMAFSMSSGFSLGRYLPIYATSLVGVIVMLLARSALPHGPPQPQATTATDAKIEKAPTASGTNGQEVQAAADAELGEEQV